MLQICGGGREARKPPRKANTSVKHRKERLERRASIWGKERVSRHQRLGGGKNWGFIISQEAGVNEKGGHPLFGASPGEEVSSAAVFRRGDSERWEGSSGEDPRRSPTRVPPCFPSLVLGEEKKR